MPPAVHMGWGGERPPMTSPRMDWEKYTPRRKVTIIGSRNGLSGSVASISWREATFCTERPGTRPARSNQ